MSKDEHHAHQYLLKGKLTNNIYKIVLYHFPKSDSWNFREITKTP